MMVPLAGMGGESSTDNYDRGGGGMIEPLPRGRSKFNTNVGTAPAGIESPFGYDLNTSSGQAMPPMLARLQPSFGVLNPAFSPHRLHYTLLVRLRFFSPNGIQKCTHATHARNARTHTCVPRTYPLSSH